MTFNNPIISTGEGSPAEPTIRSYRPVKTETESTLIQTGLLRTEIGYLADRVRRAHHEVQQYDLSERTALEVKHSVSTLLQKLADDRGMAWADIARMTGVSVSALRKWRRGGHATPEKRKELAQLVAFLDLLEELSVEDPASWIEVSLALPAGYDIRPVELYKRGHLTELLDIACVRRTAAEVLDTVDYSWRETRKSTLDVHVGPDGELALSTRDEGEQ